MEEQNSQAVRLRMKQAREMLKEAEALHNQDLWRGVINRSYYAMFYGEVWDIESGEAEMALSEAKAFVKAVTAYFKAI